MSLKAHLPKASRRGLLVAAYLGVTLVLGGGGTPTPAAEMLVQLAFAVTVIGWVWWARGSAAPVPGTPRPLLLLAAIAIALPLLQLLPLPPVLWQALPGRELELRALALIGAENSWRAVSITPYRTLASLLAIVPAVCLMLAVARLDLRDRRLLIGVVALTAFAGVALGVLQLVSGGDGAMYLYEKSHRGWLTGFFANRNAAVDALLIGSLALTCGFVLRPRVRRPSASALAIFLMLQCALLVAAVLTGSRAGIALIPVALLAEYAMVRRGGGDTRLRRITLGAVAASGALLVAGLVLGGVGRVGAVAQRFDASGDVRADLWQDSLAALSAFWPVGSGLGSFTLAFPPFERLAALDPRFPNRAHNDFLEFAIEAGVLAPIAIAVAGVVLYRLARAAMREGGEVRVQALFALGTLCIIALHSVVDYPLRTMALAGLAGVAIGMLAVPRKTSHGVERSGILE